MKQNKQFIRFTYFTEVSYADLSLSSYDAPYERTKPRSIEKAGVNDGLPALIVLQGMLGMFEWIINSTIITRG